MMTTLSRRALVVGSVTLMLEPRVVSAQRAGRISRIGIVWPFPAGPNPLIDAFEQALQSLGGVRNQNLKIETRFADRQEAFFPLASELVGLGVDVLVTWSPAGALAAKRATSQIPIVFLAVGDPIGFGLVSSLAHPGGNATGISFDAALDTYGKGLQLLKDAVPSIARVALVAASDPRMKRTRDSMQDAAKALNLALFEVEAQSPADLEAAVRTAKDRGAEGLYIWPSGLTFASAKQLADLAILNRLPSIHPFREAVVAGGLLSYAPSLPDMARRGAVYVDKILKGAKAGDLPVEQPTKLELLINLKTARALGLTIPETLVMRADQLIE